MIKKLADNISGYISNELKYDDTKREIICYGLQIFLGTSMKTLSILILAYIFNILKSTIIVSASFVAFRRIVGGSHFDTYNKCYFSSILMMLLLGMIGKIIELQHNSVLIIIISIYILTVLSTILWVPAGTEKKMIKNPNTRKQIKYKTIILLTIWIVLCSYLNSLGFVKYIVSSSLGVILAFFFVTPLCYRITNLKLL